MIGVNSVKPQIFMSASDDNSCKIEPEESKFACKKVINDYKITDYVDLTEDDHCFICDKVISRAFYSLAKTMTYRSKNLIAHKLGKLAGKKCLVIVSEDDYICQNCVNLFNQLESAEIQLKITKDCIKKHLEQKYLNSDKIHTVTNDVYTAFNLLVTKEKQPSDQSLDENRSIESKSILKEICLKDCDDNTSKKISSCTINNQQFDYSVRDIKYYPEKENKVLHYGEPDESSSNVLNNGY